MQNFDEDALAVLSCELGSRPADAPTLDDLLLRLKNVQREAKALVIEFDPGDYALVEAFVAAEQQCCPEIGWDIERMAGSVLRVSATPPQLDVLAEVFSSRS